MFKKNADLAEGGTPYQHSHVFCQENFQKGEGGQPFGKNSQKNPLLSGDANIDSGVGAVDATASKK